MGQVSVNAGEFTTAVVFKRPERERTETGAVRKTYVEAGKALVKLEDKTMAEVLDDTKVALANVVQLTTYVKREVDNTYRVAVNGREYEITGITEVKRRYMIITAKLL